MVQANVQWGILGMIHNYKLYNCLSCSNGHPLGARSASGSSTKVVAAVFAATVMVVASVASGSHVVGDLKVAIRAIAGVSSRGSRGTWHRQSDGESRGAAAGTSRGKLVARELTTRAHSCSTLENYL